MKIRTVSDPATPARAGTRGHRRASRWFKGKFLVLFLVVATLLGGAALMVPEFQEKASAIDDNKDIVWDINGGQKAYNNMIEAVRQRATGGAVLREGILQTNPNLDTSDANIFAVELQHSGVPEASETPRVRLLMRARDLFVIGWHITEPGRNSGGTILYFKGDNTGYLGPDPRESPAQTPPTLNFTGSYTDLERTGGRTRTGLTITGPVMEQAFRDLRASPERIRTDTTADAAMIFIMTIAEAARFDPLQQAFAEGLVPGRPGGYTITANDAALMNSWSSISTQVVNNLNNGGALAVEIADGDPTTIDYKGFTLGQVSAFIAIALIGSKI
ncbi:ribosome-inactivating family protein [Streptomyces geranii]|uniref:ribosome-inactivating family protein n=1 Tax=Streptomyces geranii TaxID=2058923 RepID=UPI000D0232D5|nr:ribosome-inactivating family protein [Streptomyces geranii]